MHAISIRLDTRTNAFGKNIQCNRHDCSVMGGNVNSQFRIGKRSYVPITGLETYGPIDKQQIVIEKFWNRFWKGSEEIASICNVVSIRVYRFLHENCTTFRAFSWELFQRVSARKSSRIALTRGLLTGSRYSLFGWHYIYHLCHNKIFFVTYSARYEYGYSIKPDKLSGLYTHPGFVRFCHRDVR